MNTYKRKFLSSDDYVECLICGKCFQQIHWSHLKEHGIKTSEYKSKFSLSKGELLSRSLRIERQERALSLRKQNKLTTIKFNRSFKPKVNKRISSKIGKLMWKDKTKSEISKEMSRRNNLGWKNSSNERHEQVRKNLDRTGKISPRKGLKFGNLSEDHKRRISASLKGRIDSTETKIKKSISLKKHERSLKHKERLALANKLAGLKRRIFTSDQENLIRSEYKKGKHGFGVEALSKKYKCSPSTILIIVKRDGSND